MYHVQGDLAVVHSEYLNNMLTNLTDGTTLTWLDGIRTGPAPFNNTQWTWIDGTPMIYDNWTSDNPNNEQGLQFCLCINYSAAGFWDDDGCFGPSQRAYICQIAI